MVGNTTCLQNIINKMWLQSSKQMSLNAIKRLSNGRGNVSPSPHNRYSACQPLSMLSLAPTHCLGSWI